MPRSTAAATRRQAAQAKAADEGVRLPTDVYEDLMKRAKRCSALEKYAAELEATLKHKEKIIRDQGSDWNEVYSKLESETIRQPCVREGDSRVHNTHLYFLMKRSNLIFS